MKFILGKKIGMSQLFDEQERVQPVTLVQAGPCIVTQIKTNEKDGYQSVQLGFCKRGKKSTTTKKIHSSQFRFCKELSDGAQIAAQEKPAVVGDEVTVDVFAPHDIVDVVGLSKGKGFQGVVKRQDFGGGPKTHGHRHELRKPGSTGQRFPQHTRKGQLMAGRMGGGKSTAKNLEVLWIDPKEHMIAIRGAIAGAKNSFVEIRSAKDISRKGGK